MQITTDPYYTPQFYNVCKETLKNNDVEFSEFINIKPPYDWYFDVPRKPLMVNFDVATKSLKRWLVPIVQPLRPNDAYLLMRRDNDKGPKALLKFIENEPLREARKSDYAVFFTVKNREEVTDLSKMYPGKIWYFGKYYNNKYRVCLATHPIMKGFLDPSQILLERTTELEEPGRFEAELNWRVFQQKDFLVKFTEMPYFDDGSYSRPRIRGEDTSRFNL